MNRGADWVGACGCFGGGDVRLKKFGLVWDGGGGTGGSVKPLKKFGFVWGVGSFERCCTCECGSRTFGGCVVVGCVAAVSADIASLRLLG